MDSKYYNYQMSVTNYNDSLNFSHESMEDVLKDQIKVYEKRLQEKEKIMNSLYQNIELEEGEEIDEMNILDLIRH